VRDPVGDVLGDAASGVSARRRSRRRFTPRQSGPHPRSHWRVDGQPKTRFASEGDANRAALASRLEHGVDLAVYVCEVCGGWHLGGRSDR
jgi:hypothetical protein